MGNLQYLAVPTITSSLLTTILGYSQGLNGGIYQGGPKDSSLEVIYIMKMYTVVNCISSDDFDTSLTEQSLLNQKEFVHILV